MDEYFCPKCGAILNNQDGFDPDCGTWRCTECGEMLMDDDVYNGEKFKGVAWYCDNCGALLNRQPGFSDTCGSWCCTECGHRNGITEDDIINENPEFSCPNCGVTLDFQPSFNKYDDDWECTACGAHLHHDYSGDQYSVIKEPKHKCPNCGAGLDDQWCYADYQDNWKCTECGAHLHHGFSDEEYTVIKHTCPRCNAPLDIQWGFNGYDNDWDCTECGAHLHRDFSDDDYEEIEETDESECDFSSQESSSVGSSNINGSGTTYENSFQKFTSGKQTCKHPPKIHWKVKILGAIFLMVAFLLCVVYYEVKLLTPVEYSSSDLIGRDYEEVMALLEKVGFYHVQKKEIADLTIDQMSQENKVTSVKIGIAEAFEADSKYPANFPVVLTFHTLEYLAVPISSKEAKGADYQSVKAHFEEAGFRNIAMEVEYDIITGWLAEDGEVKSVTVNGDRKFSAGTEYRADVEIIITYHTYRKNKPK